MLDARPRAVDDELDQRLDLMEEDLVEGLDEHFIALGELEEDEALDHLPGKHNQKSHGRSGTRVPPAIAEKHSSVIKGTMSIAGTGATATQPVKSMDDLYEKSKIAEPKFKKQVDSVAKATGGQSVYTPPEYAEPGTILKSRSSAERKLKTELDGDVTQLKDIIRGTVLYDKVEQARVGAAEFIAKNRDNIVRVKDRIADNNGGGYRDILINYRVPGGLIAEVQFNSAEMMKAKMGEGHKVYERLRTLDMKTATPDMISALRQQELKIYDSAYKKDGNGSWKGK